MSLTEKERRTLKQYISEGVERSTHKIEKMSQVKWGIMASSTDQMTPVGMLSWFSREKSDFYAVTFNSTSQLQIDLLALYSVESAKSMTEAVTRPYKRLKGLQDLVGLTIGEVSNILAQGVVSVLADALSSPIILSVPRVSRGPKVDLLATAFESYDGREDTLLLSRVEIFSKALEVDAAIVLILKSDSVHRRLRKLFI